MQKRFFVYGLIAGAVGMAVFGSVVASLALFALFFNAGLVWRRDEAPILPFCLSYQWLFAVTGYLWLLATDEYPGGETPGSVRTAVLLSLAAFTCLAVGVRGGIQIWQYLSPRSTARLHQAEPRYNLFLLFLLTMGANLIGFVWRADPMAIWSGGAQILVRLLEFKLVLLVWLWLTVFQQRKGYGYAVSAGALVFLSSLGNVMSSFSAAFMLFLVAVLREWRPWSAQLAERLMNRRVMTVALAVGVTVFALGLVWEGAIKGAWRSKVRSEEARTADTGSFLETVRTEAPTISLRDALESVAQRMSSDALYFSYVLDRVPHEIPHENGQLTRRALMHVLMPRFLFPNKGDLGSDSWLAIHYAGVSAAGAEQGTSIGLGYIAQFYIDFGSLVMLFALIGYGVIIGLAYGVLQLLAPSFSLWMSAATVMCFGPFASYGGEIAKLFGALILCVVIYSVVLATAGRWVHNWLAGAASPPARGPRPAGGDSGPATIA